MEWITLFDGISFNGWHGYLSDSIPEEWSIEDGAVFNQKEGRTAVGKNIGEIPISKIAPPPNSKSITLLSSGIFDLKEKSALIFLYNLFFRFYSNLTGVKTCPECFHKKPMCTLRSFNYCCSFFTVE